LGGHVHFWRAHELNFCIFPYLHFSLCEDNGKFREDLRMIKSESGWLAALLFFCCGAYAPGLLAEEEMVFEGPAALAPPQAPKSYSQEWRVLPGETLHSLAVLFYPKERRMQERFVAAALAMNHDLLGGMTADQPFEQGTTIRIPDLRSLSWKGQGSLLDAPSEAPSAQDRTDRTGQTEYEAISKRHQTRKGELDALNKRMQSLQDRSNSMQQSLSPKRLPTADEDSSKPVRRVVASETGMSDDTLYPLLLIVLLALLAVAGYFGYRRYRSSRVGLRERVLARHPPLPKQEFTEPPATLPPEDISVPAPVVEKDKPRKLILQQDDVISVGEIDSIVEEAKVIVALGRTGNAIKLLTEHIELHPRASVQPWLYLLDLYRSTANRNDFAELGKRMHKTFNVMIPAWEASQEVGVAPTSLEEFPRVIEKIVADWGKPEGRKYLNYLIQDNRDGERIGFSMEVLQQILLLQAVLDARDDMPGLDGSQ
jgi:hypothetical protein